MEWIIAFTYCSKWNHLNDRTLNLNTDNGWEIRSIFSLVTVLFTDFRFRAHNSVTLETPCLPVIRSTGHRSSLKLGSPSLNTTERDMQQKTTTTTSQRVESLESHWGDILWKFREFSVVLLKSVQKSVRVKSSGFGVMTTGQTVNKHISWTILVVSP